MLLLVVVNYFINIVLITIILIIFIISEGGGCWVVFYKTTDIRHKISKFQFILPFVCNKVKEVRTNSITRKYKSLRISLLSKLKL